MSLSRSKAEREVDCSTNEDTSEFGMIVDYHTHNRLCRHAQGEIEEYIQTAIQRGFEEIGCSDHAPLPDNYDPRHRMSVEEFYSDYAPAVSELSEKYSKQIRVKRGIEVDFLDWADEWNRKFIAENKFDFVLGSVHFVGPRGSEKALFGPDYKQSELESLNEQYFLALADSARAGLFDIISHCDIVKKFGNFSSKRVTELTREALVQIKNADICIEINTSGLRKPERETYPSERILAIARELHIPLTIGSDAHTPDDVGRDFGKALALVEVYGGGRISIFEQRQRSETRVSKLR